MQFWLRIKFWHNKLKRWLHICLNYHNNYKLCIPLKVIINVWNVIFSKVIIQMVIVPIKTTHIKQNSIIWAIREGKVASPTIIKIIYLMVEEVIKIKVLDGNKMLVHLIGKDPMNNKNHFILQFMREQVNWRTPWRNLCKHLCLIRILKVQLETWRHK